MILAPRNDPQTEIPAELNRWNWGAFLLNWIWGIGNGTYIALLALVPFVGFVMLFVLGAKGSAWAWRNGRWDSVEHFKRVQRLWAIWGVVFWAGWLVVVGGMFGGIFFALSHSEAYRLSIARLQANAEVVEALGTPITTGFPMGGINVSGSGGNAALTFSVSGPKGQGHATMIAIKRDGVWSIQKLTLRVEGRENIINVVDSTSAFFEQREGSRGPRCALWSHGGPTTSCA